MDEAVQPTGRNRDPFPATRWSLIQRAGGHEHSVDRDEDWRQLFLAYRLPIECVLRRQLPGDALADAVAEFFSYLFEHRLLQRVDRSVGSFRQFVQGVAWRFARDRQRWLQRGRRAILDSGPEVPAAAEIAAELDERAWVMGIVHEGLRRLERLRPTEARALTLAHGLAAPGTAPIEPSPTAAIAHELRITEGGVRNLLMRARRELAARITAVVVDGVDSAASAAAELAVTRHHLAAIAPEIQHALPA